MDLVVQVSEGPGQETAELELEPDGSLSMDTLCSEFGEGVTGLAYTNPTTGNRRVVRVVGKQLLPPSGKWFKGIHFIRRSIKPNLETAAVAVTVVKDAPLPPLIKPEPGTASPTTLTKNVVIKPEPGTASSATLSKKQLLALKDSNTTAWTAIQSWNRLNLSVRRLVQKAKWEGTAGMTRCEGTTAKQALTNRKLRDRIVEDPQVCKLFCTFQLPEGTVTIDHNRAYEHVRNCINSMKKTKTYMPTQSGNHSDEESSSDGNVPTYSLSEDEEAGGQKNEKQHPAWADKMESCDDDDVAKYPLSEDEEENEVEVSTRPEGATYKASNRKRRLCSIENTKAGGQKISKRCHVNADKMDDCENPYLQMREKNIQENKKMLASLGLAISEKDAIVIAKAWFKPDAVAKLSAGKILKEADKLGLYVPAKSTLQQCLCQFGRQLLQGKFVELTKYQNLSRADIIKV